MRKVFIILLSVLILPTCSQRAEESEHLFRVYNEKGITIAETTGGPKFDGEIFEYEQELILKEDPDLEESILFRPIMFTSDQDGVFYVVDTGDNRIAVFDPEGNYTRDFGRAGDGPGEFRYVNLQYIHDDTAHIWDFGHQRLTIFSTDGTLLEVITSPDRSVYLNGIFLTTEGYRVLMVSTDHQRENGFLLDTARAIIATPAGDTLASVETPWVITGHSIPSNASAWARVEFSGDPIVQYHPDLGLLATTGGTPDISLYSAAGVLFRQIHVDLEPEPVTETERRRIIELSAERARNSSGQFARMAQERHDSLKILEFKAFWDAVQVDQKGYYWLRIPEMVETINELGGTKHRVLSPEGDYLGDTRWPARLCTPADGRLFSRESDEETGQNRLVVYRIKPAVQGLRYP